MATEASPRPWRVADGMHETIVDERNNIVASAANSSIAALIVAAVNQHSPVPKTELLMDAVSENITLRDERDRLRDLVKRLANSLQGIMDAAEGKGEGVLDESLLVEARAAIGGEAE